MFKPVFGLVVLLLLVGSYWMTQNTSVLDKLNQKNKYSPVEYVDSREVLPKKDVTPVDTKKLDWPKYGQASFGVSQKGVIASSKQSEQQVPVASLAKIITALAVLKKSHLMPGENGPMIEITDKDIKIYEDYVRKNGSVTPIRVGDKLSQRQALEAIMMVSSNNISDTLVIWAFGSIENYTEYANRMLREYGVEDTRVADASGFSPKTVSTSQDMTKIALLYMNNIVLREIATQDKATLPFVGEIININSSLNEDRIVGIKVGDTDEAGRCFIIADLGEDDSESKAAVAVVLGAENIETAMQDAKRILKDGKLSYR